MFDKKHKSDICDYIDWRGDLSFEDSPFNDVDALIFAQLSYMNFSGLAPEELNSSILLSQLSKVFFGSSDFEKRSDLGMLIDPKSNELLKKAGEEGRIRFVGNVRELLKTVFAEPVLKNGAIEK